MASIKSISTILKFVMSVLSYSALAGAIDRAETTLACTRPHNYPDVPLSRDNTTATDVLNVQQCLRANGYPVNTTVAVDQSGTLIIHPGLTFNRPSNYITAVRRCRQLYGYGLATAVLEGPVLDPEDTPIGTLLDIVLSGRRITGVRRLQRATEATGTSQPLPTDGSSYMRRSSSYYYSFMSEESGCGSDEKFIDTTDMCQDNNKNSFASFMVRNPNAKYDLDFTAWPHHDCIKGNAKTYTVGPDELLSCTKRKTYSWYGALADDDCYGDDPSSSCVTKDVNTYTGTYKVWQIIVEGKY
ncbi:hypothetical protein KAFR_0D00810 [Kazachstania africana CBS 2517]|uniref:Ecp2 effector protein domain-containing protein n=1 Tax=Kazachstania africana (strain ATCC 22294 / BCRC 22015 / CBS 2517 / CECT 1963 / NBRC 1671 / NRRL Y-8276) TaxID=1071382 RepID=H2ATM8_KAZAF|nr:hypothetical protein KAFR_0D00810 [Kazachstania africana CBS 2517]CCF57728.1 hypothetical protein KAFR_0D00810 [Kazachstania africana CBS 2517]